MSLSATCAVMAAPVQSAASGEHSQVTPNLPWELGASVAPHWLMA